MRIIISGMGIGFLLLGMAQVVSAELYQYKDEKGRVWYVNRLEQIPEKYRDQVQVFMKTYGSSSSPAHNAPLTPPSPPSPQPSPSGKSGIIKSPAPAPQSAQTKKKAEKKQKKTTAASSKSWPNQSSSYGSSYGGRTTSGSYRKGS